MRLGCVVMASGAGRRFAASGGAGNKLVADAAGKPLVVRTVRSVPRERFEVVISTRWPEVRDAVERRVGSVRRAEAHDAVERHTGPTRVVLHDALKRSASVRAGLAAGAGVWDGCLFLPGDQPLVSRASFYALADAFEANPARAYRLAWNGAAASPVLFPAACFEALLSLTGSDGGASVLRAGEVPVRLVEARAEHELWDVDTRAALACVARAAADASVT